MIELVVERNPGETRIAVREDGRTLEVHFDRAGAGSRVGAVHVARATRVEPGLGAFLDIGGRVPAFLPEGREKVVEGSPLLVQVCKDEVAGKGPEVTRAVLLDGGALALTPTQPGIAISRKLTESVRKRLRAEVREMTGSADPSPGVLVRSTARGATDLAGIWQALQDEWRQIEARLGATPPALLRPPPDPVALMLGRFRPSRIIAGDATTAARLRGLAAMDVEKVDRAFEALGIEDELARALARDVEIPGGRLLVEEGETLTAIDVNGAGDRVVLCLAATREIGRTIRLRNLGGTLVVDFPFVDGKPDRDRIEAAMKAAVMADPQAVECLGWTRAGLYEMTRPRSGPSLAAQLIDVPAARPTIESAALAALRTLVRAEGGRLRLIASPEVIGWLEGAGAAALAEAGRAVALAAEPGYSRSQFDVVRE